MWQGRGQERKGPAGWGYGVEVKTIIQACKNTSTCAPIEDLNMAIEAD